MTNTVTQPLNSTALKLSFHLGSRRRQETLDLSLVYGWCSYILFVCHAGDGDWGRTQEDIPSIGRELVGIHTLSMKYPYTLYKLYLEVCFKANARNTTGWLKKNHYRTCLSDPHVSPYRPVVSCRDIYCGYPFCQR